VTNASYARRNRTSREKTPSGAEQTLENITSYDFSRSGGEKVKSGLYLARSQTFAGFGRSWYERTPDGVQLVYHTEPRGFALWRARRSVQTWGRRAA
jgi:hypothetical protein